jgi:polyferredoxin
MWRKDPLLAVILLWTALFAGVLVWLPLVRGATQGTAYSWALTAGIGGRGIGGAYWVLIIGAAFVLALLYLGWRGGRQPFHWLLLGFQVPLAAAVTYAAWTDPKGFRFEGATLGLDVSLALIGPVLFCGIACAAIFWVLRDLRARRPRQVAEWDWTRAARVRLLLLVAIIPLEVLMFRSGGIQSAQNVIGVALVGWQWVLVNRVLAGARRSPTQE